MKNLLLNPSIFALASESEIKLFETAMKTNEKMFCIYSSIEKRIVMILVFGNSENMESSKAGIKG